MPRAIPLPQREQIVQLRQQGLSLVAIAGRLALKYRTVREIWRRYRQEGAAGLAIHYDRCGPSARHFPDTLAQAALTLKRAHPRWGAGLIRLELAEQFADQPLPGERTLQTWFRQAGLQRPRVQRPPVKREPASEAHVGWQVDAKEKMRLADGSGVSTLMATDVASGAIVGVALFPPLSLDASAAGRGAAGPPGLVGGVGAAPLDAI